MLREPTNKERKQEVETEQPVEPQEDDLDHLTPEKVAMRGMGRDLGLDGTSRLLYDCD